jgi:hypothetical protein
MSAIVLSIKGAKLMQVCEAEGFASIDDLIALLVTDSVCPAICMIEGCVGTMSAICGLRCAQN